jgi:UDPglucose--hexose-1-phosphate uridylyltransferase
VAELRRHPLSGDWVVICPEKSGLLADETGEGCVYCPGQEDRTGKEIYRVTGNGPSDNPAWTMRVVAGSPPIFHVEGDFGKQGVGMCDRMDAIGAHEILVESPRHDIEFEDLDEGHILAILDTLRVRAIDLANDGRLKHFLSFKVRAFNGAAPGLHPRWHIVSAPFVPGLIKHELNAARKYFSFKERCVFCDYLLQELRAGSRVVCEDTHAIALSPYAARVPYEIWVLPLRHSPDFQTVTYDEMRSLARLLRRLGRGISKLEQSQGYVITLHTAPFRRPKPDAWKTIDHDYHWHIEIDPCISVLNGLVESGGFHLNPVSPEDAASVLSSLR